MTHPNVLPFLPAFSQRPFWPTLNNPLGLPLRVALPEVVNAVLAQPVSYYESLPKQAASPAVEPLTNVAFVLDDSSSMLMGKEQTVLGYNQQIEVVRKGAEMVGATTFTSVLFNHEVRVGPVAASLSSLRELSLASYCPKGGTALFDALGDTIAALLATPRMDSPNTATLVTLFTDGEELSSQRYSAEILGQLVERLQATGRWSFALVGPDNGVRSLAQLLKVHQGNVRGYNPTSVQDRGCAFNAMADAGRSYFSARSMGATSVMNLYSAETQFSSVR